MATNTEFAVRPMQVGAEIVGLDITRSLTEAARAALYAAWLEHGILLFRNDRPPTTEQHFALSRCFGELERHPMPEIWAEGEPYLIELGGKNSNRGVAKVYDDDKLRLGVLPWHRDTAYTVDICKGALLRMTEVPPEDGETLFADSQKAYEAMPLELRRRVDSLEFKATLRIGPFTQSGPGAIWKKVRPATREEFPVDSEETGMNALSRYPSVIHPVVITHPESGRKCLFPSPTYVDEFIGLSKTDSDALLIELCRHLFDPRHVYTHRWKAHDMMLWDNRRMLHAAAGYKPAYTRTGLRTTLAGAMKTGRYFNAQAKDFVPPPQMLD